MALLDELQGVFVEHVRRVEFALRPVDFLLASFRQAHVVVRVPLVVGVVQGVPVEFLEAALRRASLVVQMPLADVVAAVPGIAEHLAQRHATVVQAAQVGRSSCRVRIARGEAGDSGLGRVEPGHQRGATGAAARRVVEGLEADSVLSQRIDVGRVDLAAVATEVGVAEIVEQHDQDVRLVGEAASHATGEKNEREQNASHVHEGITTGRPDRDWHG